MKNIRRFVLFTIILILTNLNVYAECNDEDLNAWADKVKSKYVYNAKTNSDYLYAYFIGIDNYRDDIKIEVTDGSGAKAEGRIFEKIDNLYAVGCYTNFEEETYTINIYGNSKSKCSNELLKTLKYTVPRLNRARKDALCEKYKDHELCQPFTNETKDMTTDEVHKILEKYDKEVTKIPKIKESLWIVVLKYALYILIPFGVIALIYMTKVGKIRKGEKKK